MDVIGPLPLCNGHTAILVIVDAATGWCEIIPLIRDDALYVAHAFLSEWVCRYGLPRSFLSDRGPSFLNIVIDILL